MKTRESGMPADELWRTFFEPEAVLTKLGLTADCRCVVDFGCGYGTFSVPAARMIQGSVYALDIDPGMVESTKAKGAGLPNLFVLQQDFAAAGCGLPDGKADYVMLFNILHAQEAAELLAEAKRVLKSGGRLGVMHWNYDPTTPRGPSMNIRLRPEECVAIVERAGFSTVGPVQLPPYHFGLIGTRP